MSDTAMLAFANPFWGSFDVDNRLRCCRTAPMTHPCSFSEPDADAGIA